MIARVWPRLPPPVRRLYHGLNLSLGDRLLPDRAAVATIRYGLNRGLMMHLNLRRDRGYYLGTHEPAVQALLQDSLNPGQTVVIVGGHLGFYAIGVARLVGAGGAVIVFEPNPAVVPRLQTNLSLNDLPTPITLHSVALSDHADPVELVQPANDMQGHLAGLPGFAGAVIQVEARRLDDYALAPDWVLIDAEHAEHLVLRGMTNTLTWQRPRLLIEMHGPPSTAPAWEILQQHAYCLHHLPTLAPITDPAALAYGHYLCQADGHT